MLILKIFIRKTKLVALVVLTVTAFLGFKIQAAPEFIRKPLLLKPLNDRFLPRDSIAAICLKLSKPCDPSLTKVYIASSKPEDPFYLIDESKPMLVRLEKGLAGEWRVTDQWDFSEYRHSSRPLDDFQDSKEPLFIHPALYPIGDKRWAIAIVSKQSEGYAGGGAWFSVADFVLLSPLQGEGPSIERIYAGVPFSCAKQIRACFTEEEYRTSRHCHETWAGSLSIVFPRRSDLADPSWRFSWHERYWPPHVTHAQSKVIGSSFRVLRADGTSETVGLPEKLSSFCNGRMDF